MTEAKKAIRIGIIFGGCSREREISFAGGRTVYDNLDRGLFEAVPIFVDSHGNFIQLAWRYLYQGTIRDFYPPNERKEFKKVLPYIESFDPLPSALYEEYISQIGQRIDIERLKGILDIAFLVLHGPYGEDGRIQGLLEWCQIPYSGSGILGSALGIDKIVQKRWMERLEYPLIPYQIISRASWLEGNKKLLWEKAKQLLGLPLVVKSPRQGSSIGVSLVREDDLTLFQKAVDRSFFIEEITAQAWQSLSEQEKEQWLIELIDLRTGIGLPVLVGDQVIHHPTVLFNFMEAYFKEHAETLVLHSIAGEDAVLIEAFIAGREFSCIVLQEAGEEPVALLPTEMLKGALHFDYRAKYLPGLVRKETPMQVSPEQLEVIRATCIALFKDLYFQTYARIDGILSPNNQIYLNDPNTTAGMQPSSFLFHQAAALGLSPTQLLTFLIRNSLATSLATYRAPLKARQWLETIDRYVAEKVSSA
jgi:D-alanine--D-alanine ligase